MGEEKRRALREDSILPVNLILRDDQAGMTLANPVPAEIVDMSVYGVRITVSRVRFGEFHLFYSFNDNPHLLIQICFNSDGEQEDIIIPSYPVWFDHLVNTPGQPFQLGMEFLSEPQDENIRKLEQLIRRNRKAKLGWLKSIFSTK
jgi:hypothetical protein